MQPHLRAIALLVPVTLAAASHAGREPVVEHARRGDALVVRLWAGSPQAAGNAGRVLEIWGDGRVVVRRPLGVTGSREAETRLTEAELAGLLSSLASSGVLDFDPARTRFEVRRAVAGRAATAQPASHAARVPADGTPTRLEVNVSRYLPEGPGGPERRNVSVEIDWIGLAEDARNFPDLQGLRELSDAHAQLARLFDRRDLR